MSYAKNNKRLPRCLRIKNRFLRALFSPFIVGTFDKLKFFVWIMFIIVASQLGTIINLIQRVLFGDWEFCQSICADSSSGNFYTFSLVLIASLLNPMFQRFIDNHDFNYRRIGVAFTTVSIFSLIFCAVFFTSSGHNEVLKGFKNIPTKDIGIDWWQLLFFCVAILSAFYSFGLDYLKEFEPEIGLDDKCFYSERENNDVEAISDIASTKTDDGNGNRL